MMGDSRVQQFVPVKKVGTDITPKVPGDSMGFQRLKPEINAETLAANRTLLTTDYMAQWLDPDGADRDVTLPAEADSTNLLFIILNTANGAGEDLVIKNDTPTTIATLGPGQSGMFSCDGTNWKWEDAVDYKLDIIAQQTIYPQVNDAATPTLAFGDGNTGFYESADDEIHIGIAGVDRIKIDSSGNFKSPNSSRWGLLNENASATNPNIVPINGDSDTGIGSVGSDILSLIAGGIEGLRIIEDTSIEIRIPKNDSWLSELNFAGTDVVNMFKANVDDEIDVGGSLTLGSIEAAEDSGPVTLVDMPVSATPAAASEMSFLLKIDGDGILKIYAEADSAGGIQNPSVRPQVPVVYDQTPQTLTGAGAVNLTTQITHVDTTGGAAALTLVDGVEGQEKFIVMTVDVGAGTLTPTNLGGANTKITFDDVGDTAHLLFTDGAWQFMGGTATLAL